MACYKPLRAWRGSTDRGIYWRQINDSEEISIRCGKCIGCRLDHSRGWAIRCVHEAKTRRYNSFLTLTINDEHLTNRYNTGLIHHITGQPVYSGTLNLEDHTRFFKRLGKKAESRPESLLISRDGIPTTTSTTNHNGANDAPQTAVARRRLFSYYLGAEYGTKYMRPHYHVCLFGIDFADKKYFSKSPTGAKLYRSATLEKLWPLGYSTIGEITFESAAYTARYVMKKINGEMAKKHYEKIDQDTGEIFTIKNEYNVMSRGKNNAIGRQWIERFMTDVYPHGTVIVRGKEQNAPRYYNKQWKKLDPLAYQDLQLEREMEAMANWRENEIDRLYVREQVAQAKLKYLKRKI